MLGWILAVVLLVLPLLEMWFFSVSSLPLVGVVLWSAVSAAVGWRFARREDLSLWSELEADVRNNRLPTIEGVDAMIVVLGGWGLVVPGFLTDVVGAVLLTPWVRRELTDTVRRTIRHIQH